MSDAEKTRRVNAALNAISAILNRVEASGSEFHDYTEWDSEKAFPEKDSKTLWDWIKDAETEARKLTLDI